MGLQMQMFLNTFAIKKSGKNFIKHEI